MRRRLRVDDPCLTPIVEACAETGSIALVGAPVDDGHGGVVHRDAGDRRWGSPRRLPEDVAGRRRGRAFQPGTRAGRDRRRRLAPRPGDLQGHRRRRSTQRTRPRSGSTRMSPASSSSPKMTRFPPSVPDVSHATITSGSRSRASRDRPAGATTARLVAPASGRRPGTPSLGPDLSRVPSPARRSADDQRGALPAHTPRMSKTPDLQTVRASPGRDLRGGGHRRRADPRRGPVERSSRGLRRSVHRGGGRG